MSTRVTTRAPPEIVVITLRSCVDALILLYDFEHAGAALAHCQAFFTERPLWQMVTSKHIALDRLLGCQVAWDLDDAIVFLAGLESADGSA